MLLVILSGLGYFSHKDKHDPSISMDFLRGSDRDLFREKS